MNISIIGAGPAGLYFAILMKRRDPSHEITVFERDGPDDTFGWGIVFSDQTFSYLEQSDEPSFRRILESCAIWDNVDIVHRGERISIRGNKFSAIGRLAFLHILHRRCEELGVVLRFRTSFGESDPLPDGDLLIGADGANSTVRRLFAREFQPTLDVRRNKYIWLGTPRLVHGLTLTFREHAAGLFAAHSYKFNPSTSTFIVECSEATWDAAGFAHLSERETCRLLEEVFADDLAGEPLLTNNFVRWINFLLIRNARWRHRNVALLGDALHTAHFSIGSGTKLALGDAIELADAFVDHPDVEEALAAFEARRRPTIEAYQEAAYESLLWFENMGQYVDLPPLPFAYSLMTRSKKIDREKLRQRDGAFVQAYERWAASGNRTGSK